MSNLTPLMRQYYDIKRQHPDKVLFFQTGDFFEMFGEDAVTCSKALNIQLTSRDKNTENSLPMCGIPLHAMEQYLNKLIQLGCKVAVCEQVEDAKNAKGLLKRDVTRIVTPGTALSSDLLESTAFSFVGAFLYDKKEQKFGIAFCDLSTGQFQYSDFHQKGALEHCCEMISIYNPKEILLDHRLQEEEDLPFPRSFLLDYLQDHQIRVEFLEPQTFILDKAKRDLQKILGIHVLSSSGLENRNSAILACATLIQWLHHLQKSPLNHLKIPQEIRRKGKMTLDMTTIRNLEIFQNLIEKDASNTLFSLMNKTQTPMGARLLRETLASPFYDQKPIEERLDAIEEIHQKMKETETLRSLFHPVGDLERIIGRISLPGVSVYDMVRLRGGISDFPEILHAMQNFETTYLQTASKNFDSLEDIHAFLTEAILPSPNLKIKDGGYIADGFSPELDKLRNIQKNAKSVISELEETEKKNTGISNLKIKYNRIFGYFLEISHSWKHLTPSHYVCKQTLSNAERYITQELKELEEEILNAEERIIELEIQLFEKIKEKLRTTIQRVQKTASAIASFDFISGLAKLAEERDYCRPQFLSENENYIAIQAARHPVIEALDFDEPFIANDLALDKAEKFMMLITGPNMGGKSTFMRQIALLACMAQAGSFVPAHSATLPLFDRIFTRVGASDNLAKGQSTFMVEMNEAAVILNNATEKSLVILDEIGRGTGTYDGISIAWAIAEHLHKTGAYTLFATHYHELTSLEEECEGILNASVSVKDENGKIIFLRKILPGKIDKSYGIQVAKLAGLPTPIIDKAQSVLQHLQTFEEEFKAKEIPNSPYNQNRPPSRKRKTVEEMFGTQQQKLFEEKNWLEEKLETCDINNLTPLKALEFLNELKTLAELKN